MKIKDLDKVDLPREKLAKYGSSKLKDYELLAILLGSGIKGLNVLELSKKILKSVDKIGIKKITIKDLSEIKGLGKTKASQVLALFELGKRLNSENKIEILSAKDIWNMCADFRDSTKEHFVVFYLDARNQIIKKEFISTGTINSNLIHPREVFEPAVRNLATNIIITHNHPSGNFLPSDEDIKITKKLQDAGRIMGIEIFDHIVVSKSGYLSFKKESLI